MPAPSPLPAWHQPVGTWRRRGASRSAIRVGLGLSPLHDLEAGTDLHGYTLWHYWANAPGAAQSFDPLLRQLGPTQANALAERGEHPWHFLLLAGDLGALNRWRRTLGVPAEPDPPLQGDSFSHCIAWSGEPAALRLFDETQMPFINDQDANGLTPLIVAVHRGDARFVEAFLMAGADPMVADAQGRNALHHAAQYGDAGLVSLLEDSGGEAGERDFHGLSARDVLRTRRQTPEKDLLTLREHWLRRKAARLAF